MCRCRRVACHGRISADQFPEKIRLFRQSPPSAIGEAASLGLGVGWRGEGRCRGDAARRHETLECHPFRPARVSPQATQAFTRTWPHRVYRMRQLKAPFPPEPPRFVIFRDGLASSVRGSRD